MRSILAILCIIFSTNSFALSLRDSIGVENTNGKQTIIHQVSSKETYYSIGRRYGVSPKDIQNLNKTKTLQPGMQLRVPTSRPFVVQTPAASAQSGPQQTGDLIDYKVGPKETLYAIARRFQMSVQDLKKINNLTRDNLAAGQILKVRLGGTRPEDIAVVPSILTDSSDSASALKVPKNRYGLTEMSEQGIAVWIDDENLDGTKMLALHKLAPVGTVIKITNPMSGKSTFAKVVGRYNENETTRDVIIVLTKATADLLGALDKRFRVTIDYGVPNE